MENVIRRALPVTLLLFIAVLGIQGILKHVHETAVLKQIVSRLEAESRIAEALVSSVKYDEETGKLYTTVKFLEYASTGESLEPKYFTFSGNVIQFQSLVIRFDDIHVRNADKFRGKSAYLFWKVFMLDGYNTQEYEVTKAYGIPEGYRVEMRDDAFEKKLWEKFWKYALDLKESGKIGVKNAQIEAPGTMFVPGMLYTIVIEHDGGMRIDAKPLPSILRGEKILPAA